jgi:signal transduction histidine kinase
VEQRTNKKLETESELRSRMWNMVSHEIKTPLAVLSTHAEVVAATLRAEGVSEAQARALDVITDEVQQLTSLVIDWGNLPSLQERITTSSTSLSTALARVHLILRARMEDREVQLKTKIPTTLPALGISEMALEHVLLNLLVNALNHTNTGTITVTGHRHDDMVEVTVADTGEGIAAEHMSLVFESGFTTSSSGNGNGLAVCRWLIRSCGGTIWVNSEFGKGTEFHFRLPIAEDTDQTAHTTLTKPNEPRSVEETVKWKE